MARPERHKTPLGQRLTEARKALGHEHRAPFAELIGVPLETLANYERGDRDPPVNLLSAYHMRFGINLSWLLSGSGDVFDDPSKAPAEAVPDIAATTMRRLVSLVERFYLEEAKRKLPTVDTASEATLLYNELRRRGTNAHDAEAVEAALPALRLYLKRRLEQAAADPTTDKRRA